MRLRRYVAVIVSFVRGEIWRVWFRVRIGGTGDLLVGGVVIVRGLGV